MLREGDIVAGRYRVEARLGEGALSEVWRVRHVELGSTHALKLLTLRKERLAERLILEGRIQAQLRHPDIVAVTDVVRHEGFVGLVMEHVDGVPLDLLLDQHGALDTDRALELMTAVLSAVNAAHQAGVLHRDLKPANILLARTSQGWMPKVADFGIAKVVEGESDLRATRVGSVMGTPGYLAPEQASDASDADARADVFALGAILYELLSGRRAFHGADGDLFRFDPPRPLDRLVHDVPEHVAEAVHRAMALPREARFDSVDALAAALLYDRPALLERVRGRGDVRALALSLPEVATATASPETLTPVTRPPVEGTTADVEGDTGGAGALPWLLVAIAVVLLGASATLGLWLAQEQGPQTAVVAPGEAAPVEVAPVELVPVAPEAAAPEPEVEPVGDPEETPDAPPPQPVAAPAEVAPAAAPVTSSPAPAAEEVPKVEPVAASRTTSAPEAPAAPQGEAEAPEVVPAPPPEAGSAEPEPPPPPSYPQLLGRFDGEANGLPLRLRVTSQEGGRLSADATFVLGPTERRYQLDGSVSPGGAVQLVDRDGGLSMTGTMTGTELSGTYMAQGARKALPFGVTWKSR